MGRYKRHVFVCINERPEGHPKGCCLHKGSPALRDTLKAEVAQRGLQKHVRINNAGCLDACEFGASIVIYPEGIWYGGVTKADIPDILNRTILNGEVIERLLIKDERFTPDTLQIDPLELPEPKTGT